MKDWLRKWVGGLVLALVLAAGLWAYRQTDFVLSMAYQLWMCF